MTYLLLSLLALHLIALVLMAGTTLLDFISLGSFWKLSATGQEEKAAGVLEATSSYSRISGIGAAVIIVTGLLMMVVTHGVFGEQLWFRIKFGLVIILVANNLFVGRKLGQRLRKMPPPAGLSGPLSQAASQKKQRRFFLTQLLLFIVIIFLSIFKFN